MKTIFNILENRPSLLIWWLGFIFAMILVFADVVVGNTFTLEPFLIFPIILSSWYGSKRAGVLLAIFTTVAWFISNELFSSQNLSYVHTFYNTVIHLDTPAMFSPEWFETWENKFSGQ